VAGHAAVGVDDDLATGQTGVAHRATDLELAGGVDQQPVAVGVGGRRCLEDGSITCFADVRGEHAPRDVLGVLGAEDHGVDANRPVVAVVLDGDLGLAVGTQVGQRAVLADLGQALGQRCAIEIGSGISSGVSSQA
jgi:hypothetical protein